MGILDKVTTTVSRVVKEIAPELPPPPASLQELQLNLDVPGLKDDFKPSAPANPKYAAAPAYEQVSAGTSVLARGQKGPAVTELAGQLTELGHDTGEPKDKFGPKTHAAVVAFQKTQGLAPNGVVDQKTLHALEGASNQHALENDAQYKTLSPEHQAQLSAALAKDPRNKALGSDLRALAGDQKFRKLNSGTATEVLNRVPGDAAQRKNLLDLAKSDGFGQLNAEHQKKSLEALDKAPGDAELSKQLQDLSGSESFRHLDDGTKSQALDAVKTHAADPAARGPLFALAGAPGFDKLPASERTVLLRAAGSDDATYGPAVRGGLKTLTDDPAFKAKSPDDQKAALQEFMKKQDFLPAATTAADGTFAAPGKRAPYTVSAPTTLPDGKKKYEIEIEGKKFPVTVSAAPAGTKHHSIDEVARALAAVPKRYRDEIKEVTLEPNVDPENAYMRSSSAGRVYMYPGAGDRPSEDFMASAVIHETGHTVSGKAWTDDVNNAKWDGWKEAMKKDGLSASKYAHTTPGAAKTAGGGAPYADDYADTLLLYARVKGTPEEAKMRALFPERFRILDTM